MSGMRSFGFHRKAWAGPLNIFLCSAIEAGVHSVSETRSSIHHAGRTHGAADRPVDVVEGRELRHLRAKPGAPELLEPRFLPRGFFAHPRSGSTAEPQLAVDLRREHRESEVLLGGQVPQVLTT